MNAAIFARGPVDVVDGVHLVIVSCDEVTVDFNVMNCLVIARGKVTCAGAMTNCRIISGKSVICNRKNVTNCIITENEANPLGFIRFSDAPRKGTESPKKGDSK